MKLLETRTYETVAPVNNSNHIRFVKLWRVNYQYDKMVKVLYLSEDNLYAPIVHIIPCIKEEDAYKLTKEYEEYYRNLLNQKHREFRKVEDTEPKFKVNVSAVKLNKDWEAEEVISNLDQSDIENLIEDMIKKWMFH